MSKKTAFVWVLVIAGTLALWKFFWKPMSDEKLGSGRGVRSEEQGAMMGSGMANAKKANVRTNYKNPGGSDDVTFTLTVDQNGAIVDAVVEVLAVNPISKVRQEAFAKDFPAALKGKRLSELTSIDRVGGSSLTTGAFNAALPELKGQL